MLSLCEGMLRVRLNGREGDAHNLRDTGEKNQAMQWIAEKDYNIRCKVNQ